MFDGKKIYKDSNIGSRIRSTREHLRYTQEGLGKLVGVNTQHISDIERGESGFTVAKLMRFCEILNISADYILFGKESAFDGSPLLAAIKKLDDKERDVTHEMIELYLKKLK